MKILLVGTTKKIKDYNLQYFQKAREQGYTIITWSGGITLFRDINFSPDYYSFLDPLSTMWYDEMQHFKNSQLNKNISLILADMYEGIFVDKKNCEYYKIGYTCVKAEKKSDSMKNDFIQQLKQNNFKQSIKLKPHPLIVDKISEPVDFKNSFHILTNPGHDTDKLTSFLIPMVLYYFDSVKEIKCIGFGDIPLDDKPFVGRYVDKTTNSSWVGPGQDHRFFNNYKKNIPIINLFLNNNSIELNFEYENAYSKHMSYPVKQLKF